MVQNSKRQGIHRTEVTTEVQEIVNLRYLTESQFGGATCVFSQIHFRGLTVQSGFLYQSD